MGEWGARVSPLRHARVFFCISQGSYVMESSRERKHLPYSSSSSPIGATFTKNCEEFEARNIKFSKRLSLWLKRIHRKSMLEPFPYQVIFNSSIIFSIYCPVSSMLFLLLHLSFSCVPLMKLREIWTVKRKLDINF